MCQVLFWFVLNRGERFERGFVLNSALLNSAIVFLLLGTVGPKHGMNIANFYFNKTMSFFFDKS